MVTPRRPAPRGIGRMLDVMGDVVSTRGSGGHGAGSLLVVETKPSHMVVGPYCVVRTVGRGRGLAAAQQLDAGELVLRCVVHAHHTHTHT